MNQTVLSFLQVALAALATVAFVFTNSPQPFAHTKMNTSLPADGEVVKAGLSQITLKFAGTMRLTVVKVRRGVEDATEIETSDLPSSFVSSANITVDPLEAGHYAVEWIGVGKDGHMMKGSFAFDVSGP